VARLVSYISGLLVIAALAAAMMAQTAAAAQLRNRTVRPLNRLSRISRYAIKRRHRDRWRVVLRCPRLLHAARPMRFRLGN
jgi:hypothetical protein